MIPYQLFNFDLLKYGRTNRKNDVIYSRDIFTFDIETTSVFIDRSGTVRAFDRSKKPKFYQSMTKQGYMYIWQFGINDLVLYVARGRSSWTVWHGSGSTRTSRS